MRSLAALAFLAAAAPSFGAVRLHAVVEAGPESGAVPDADALPPLRERVETAVAEGVAWLLANQSERGTWGSHHSPRPIEVLCDVPGSHHAFRVATTALCVSALADSGVDSPAVAAAIDRGIDGLLEQWEVKRADALEHYSVWAFGYAPQGLGEHLLRSPDDPRRERILEVCAKLVDKLGRYQCLDGGWGYLSLSPPRTYQPSFTSMSFTTATILVGLERAGRAGVDVPEKMLKRALDSVERCRTPLGAFTYGELWNRAPASKINLIKGAACRTPACQYALNLFGREVAPADFQRGLRDLLVKHARFQVVALRRPIPHESWYAISGYFYLYGHAYAAYVLADSDEEDRRRFAAPMAEAVLKTRQPDGSFWDYPLYSYHKPYGTAYALMALARVDPAGLDPAGRGVKATLAR